MRRQRHVVVLALLCGFCGLGARAASAQAPAYVPYGAWRGRIHTVEGPFGRRTFVRWGGGITPAGSQMILGLANVAAQVATDPNVLGALARESRELDPAIAEINNDIADNNTTLRTRLDALAQKMNVQLQPLANDSAEEDDTGADQD